MKDIHRLKQEADWILHALVLPESEVRVIESCEQGDSFLKEMMTPELSRWTTEQFDEALACEEARRREIYAGIEARYREESQVLSSPSFEVLFRLPSVAARCPD